MAEVKKDASTALTIYPTQSRVSLQKIFIRLRDKQTDPFYGYTFAILLSVVAFALIFFLRIAFDMQRFSLFLLLFPLIAFSSLYGGFRAGALTTLLTALSLIGLYTYQYQSLETFPIDSTIQSVIFIVESLFISFLIDKVKRFDILSKYATREKQQKK